MSAQTESVRQLLADLHAERVRSWDPAQLQANIDQRRHLVETANYAAFIKAGDVVEPFEVEEVGGARLKLDDLLETGPLVLIFFRFAGCPACNIALPYYQRQLQPKLKTRGATLLALSPQVPGRLAEIKARHRLDFLVATDRDNAIGKRFGIVFEPDETSKAAASARGGFIGDVTGTGTWELPMPTVVVVGQDRRVRFADVAPDWLLRTEAAPIVEAVDSIRLSAAA